MTTWGSAYLLTKFNQLAGRPSSSDVITDPQKYQRLADAQNVVIEQIAAIMPWSLYPRAGYGSYPTLTTTDNQVFTFGNDVNGDPLFPIGKVGIYPSTACIPDDPWTEGFDYINEGNQIRIPNNRTYTGTLYWMGIAPVLDITGTNPPSIQPPPSRVLIAIEAVRTFASEGNRNQDLYDRMQGEWDRVWPRWCLVWRGQYRSGGALSPLVSSFAADPAWTGGFGSLGGY